MKPSECNDFEGDRICDKQVIPSDGLNDLSVLPSGNVWCCLQNNNNNEYYFSLADGSYNNNNKNNKYWVVPIESEELTRLVFEAESDCWKNKHSSWDAAKYHYHLGRIFTFIDKLYKGEYDFWKSICFVVLYPKPREIFAAHYQDRILHHIVAPYIIDVAEAVHNANGNVSFGNRKGMSAYHACLRVQRLMREHPNGYVATFDISSCFMSVDKETAWRVFCMYEKKYRPVGYNENERLFIMHFVRMMIMHNPANNCDLRSSERLLELIPKCKSLRYTDGLPIGNYYSQLIVSLILEIPCELLLEFNPTDFVDDFAVVIDVIEDYHEAKKRFDLGMRILKMTANVKKFYIQKVWAGVKWCGHFIKPTRMHVYDRQVRNCLNKINTIYSKPSLRNARKLVSVLNSYTGSLCHCADYNKQKLMVKAVFSKGYGKYLYFKHKPNKIICVLKERYTRIGKSERDLRQVNRYILTSKNKRYDSNSCKKERKALRGC